jgi:hypothetical protein
LSIICQLFSSFFFPEIIAFTPAHHKHRRISCPLSPEVNLYYVCRNYV